MLVASFHLPKHKREVCWISLLVFVFFFQNVNVEITKQDCFVD